MTGEMEQEHKPTSFRKKRNEYSAFVEDEAARGDVYSKLALSLGKTVGSWVWAKHPILQWTPAEVVKAGDDVGGKFIVRTQGGEEIDVESSHITDNVHPSCRRGVPDLLSLGDFTEAALLHNVRMRYNTEEIYTSIGSPILISVNPYSEIKNLYSEETAALYREQAAAAHGLPLARRHKRSSRANLKLKPHLFGVAQEAYTSLLTEKKNRSIIISGESGAGKTEAAKRILSYLASAEFSDDSSAAMCQQVSIEAQVLKSNPILEAFGNAKTVRNDNSSRFGKFIEIYFDPGSGRLKSARISNYLLEKCRIVNQQPRERGYHVFYELAHGTYFPPAAKKDDSEASASPSKSGTDARGSLPRTSEEFRRELHLEDPSLFRYLCPRDTAETALLSSAVHDMQSSKQQMSGSDTVSTKGSLPRSSSFESVDSYASGDEQEKAKDDKNILDCERKVISNGADATKFTELLECMRVLKFSENKIFQVFRLTSGVMHLGNMTFHEGSDGAQIVSEDTMRITCELLKLDSASFSAVLKYKQIKDPTSDATILVPRRQTEAEACRDAISKAVYSRMFNWLVRQINKAFVSRKGEGKSLTIGLLDIYGFEVFDCNSFEQLCINYANEKLQQHFNGHIFHQEQKLYTSEGIDWAHIDFVDNQNIIDALERKPAGIFPMLDDQIRLPQTTDQAYVNRLLKENKDCGVIVRCSSGLKRGSFIVCHYAGMVEYLADGFLEKNKDDLHAEVTECLGDSSDSLLQYLFVEDTRGPGRAPSETIGKSFRDQLSGLMRTLCATSPSYIRCVKPNGRKRPFEVDSADVLRQLRCAGTLESIRIRKSGYSVRRSFREFFLRYRVLYPKKKGKSDIGSTNCFELDHESYVKASKVILTSFESAWRKADKQVVTKPWQMGKTQVFMKHEMLSEMEKKCLSQMRGACITVVRSIRGFICRKNFFAFRQAAKVIQTTYKTRKEREYFIKLRSTTIFLQSLIRRRLQQIRTNAYRSRATEAALNIQRIARGRQAFLYARGLRIERLRAELRKKQMADLLGMDSSDGGLPQDVPNAERKGRVCGKIEATEIVHTETLSIRETVTAENMYGEGTLMENVTSSEKIIKPRHVTTADRSIKASADNSSAEHTPNETLRVIRASNTYRRGQVDGSPPGYDVAYKHSESSELVESRSTNSLITSHSREAAHVQIPQTHLQPFGHSVECPGCRSLRYTIKKLNKTEMQANEKNIHVRLENGRLLQVVDSLKTDVETFSNECLRLREKLQNLNDDNCELRHTIEVREQRHTQELEAVHFRARLNISSQMDMIASENAHLKQQNRNLACDLEKQTARLELKTDKLKNLIMQTQDPAHLETDLEMRQQGREEFQRRYEAAIEKKQYAEKKCGALETNLERHITESQRTVEGLKDAYQIELRDKENEIHALRKELRIAKKQSEQGGLFGGIKKIFSSSSTGKVSDPSSFRNVSSPRTCPAHVQPATLPTCQSYTTPEGSSTASISSVSGPFQGVVTKTSLNEESMKSTDVSDGKTQIVDVPRPPPAIGTFQEGEIACFDSVLNLSPTSVFCKHKAEGRAVTAGVKAFSPSRHFESRDDEAHLLLPIEKDTHNFDELCKFMNGSGDEVPHQTVTLINQLQNQLQECKAKLAKAESTINNNQLERRHLYREIARLNSELKEASEEKTRYFNNWNTAEKNLVKLRCDLHSASQSRMNSGDEIFEKDFQTKQLRAQIQLLTDSLEEERARNKCAREAENLIDAAFAPSTARLMYNNNAQGSRLCYTHRGPTKDTSHYEPCSTGRRSDQVYSYKETTDQLYHSSTQASKSARRYKTHSFDFRGDSLWGPPPPDRWANSGAARPLSHRSLHKASTHYESHAEFSPYVKIGLESRKADRDNSISLHLHRAEGSSIDKFDANVHPNRTNGRDTGLKSNHQEGGITSTSSHPSGTSSSGSSSAQSKTFNVEDGSACTADFMRQPYTDDDGRDNSLSYCRKVGRIGSITMPDFSTSPAAHLVSPGSRASALIPPLNLGTLGTPISALEDTPSVLDQRIL